ncbi:MAG: GTP-binding protein HflX [Saprospiraceae bacterium]|jgi:GTP-binding protein HflX
MSDQWDISRKKMSGIARKEERAVLVAVVKSDQSKELVEEYLNELEFLALTAGATTVKRFVQNVKSVNSRTFVGIGKAEEIEIFIEENDIDLVIFDDDLTAKQTNILEEMLKRKIIDRSTLILDIFASRAQTAQAKAQVELAQLQYLLPRLRGLWTHLERQKGGIGMRGPGEQEIETDRRIIRDKVSALKKRLIKIDQQNQTQRNNRGDLIRVALVGYTNVGKSTLMNLLSKSKLFAEDKLFATLDTTVRKVVFGRMPFLLSDTVGFIRKLPHHLVESFKSTLDEVRESDLILHVVDISHDQYEDQINTVNETMIALGVDDKKQILVFNKIDAYRKKAFDDLLEEEVKTEILTELKEKVNHNYRHPSIFISAIKKENIDGLRVLIKDSVQEQYRVRYPYQIKNF